ncbi:MAG: hypothetical protein IT422_15730 [Pirellulaceae bacterium]|nr:hypothetical protein [Pirellulaceae bacterium]
MRKHLITPEQACTGVLATGRPGSGKTTFLKHLLESLLRQGVTCQVYCVKPDAAKEALEIFKRCRIKPTIVTPETKLFNPLLYYIKRGRIHDLTKLHEDAEEIITRSDSGRTETFWKSNNATTMATTTQGAYQCYGKNISYQHLRDIFITAPRTTEEAKTDAAFNTPAGRMANHCLAQGNDAPAQLLFKTLPSYGEKAAGAILGFCLSTTSRFAEPPFNTLLSGSNDNLLQHMVFATDIARFGAAGQQFQLMMKWMSQDQVLARTGRFPYFAQFNDEYHFLAHAMRDINAVSLGRSQRYIHVGAYQNLLVFTSAFGGDAKAKTEAEALFHLHVTKAMCNNNCTETNETCSKVLGMDRKYFFSGGIDPKQQLEWYDVFGVGRPQINFSQQYHYRFEPHNFMRLRTGGRANKYCVDFVLHRGASNFTIETISQR